MHKHADRLLLVQLWIRRQFPDAHVLYRSSFIYKLGVSYDGYPAPQPPVIPFNEALAYVANISLLSDGMNQVAYLVGWQGTGEWGVGGVVEPHKCVCVFLVVVVGGGGVTVGESAY